MEIFSFNDELDRINNSPINKIHHQVKQYMLTKEYQTYAETIYPIDRANYIYVYHYKTLQRFFEALKTHAFVGADSSSERASLLLDAITQTHSYLSAQFSLLNILREHGEVQLSRNELLDVYNKFKDLEITKFFLAYKDNILHQVYFSTVLKFHSEAGFAKLVYSTADLLAVYQWNNLKDFVSSFGDEITIEDLILEYHKYVSDFLENYETILFKNNTQIFGEVLTTLHSFTLQYQDIGQSGFLPVTQEYLAAKLRFLPGMV